MARAHFRDALLSESIPPRLLAGATVNVYEPGTTDPIAATMYAAESGSTTVANPITTAANGEVSFWLDAQQAVDLRISHPDYATRTVRVQVEAASSDEVLLSGAQTITGTKTMTSPVLNTPTVNGGSIDGAAFANGTVDDSAIDGGTITDTVLGGLKSASARVLEIVSTSMVMRSPDGTKAATLTNAGVFTAPGLLRFFGYINVLDIAGVLASGGSGQAATNTSALNASFASEQQGRWFFPAGDYPIGAGLNVNHNQGSGSAKSITLCGVAGRSSLTLYGTEGPWISFGTNSNSPLYGGGIEDLIVYHGATPASGATIAVGNITSGAGIFAFNGLRIKRSSSPNAALIGIQIGIGAFGGGLHFDTGKIELRDDGAAAPVGLLFANSAPTSGLRFHNLGIDGDLGVSTGVRFQNSGAIDTIQWSHVSIKDHSICVHISGNCTAAISNVYWGDCILDVCQDFDILAQPGSGGSAGNWNWAGTFLSCEETNVHIDESNGGTMGSWRFLGGDTHNATVGIFNLGAGVSNIEINGMECGSSINTAGQYGIDCMAASGAGSGVTVVNCPAIVVGASASGALRMSTAVEPFVVVGNTFRGVNASIPADNGTSKRNGPNAFLA